MPRKVRAKDIQRARGEWWSFHYDLRQKVKALNVEQLRNLQYVCSLISPPVMTVFGGASFDSIGRDVYELASKYRIDPLIVNSWYASDEGWNQFLDLWKQLPEPVDLYTPPCVQIGELYTVSTASEIELP